MLGRPGEVGGSRDPWGKPYKVVMQKLRSLPISGELEVDVLERMVEMLFPTQLVAFTQEKVLAAI